MKLDKHGIRFRIFIIYFAFAICIVLFLGILQFSLIRPYYRENKINMVKQVSDQIDTYMIESSGSTAEISRAFQVTVDNNVCVVLFNDQGHKVYDADSLGSGCVFHTSPSNVEGNPVSLNDGTQLINYLTEQGGEVSINLNNLLTKQEMVVYGRTINANLGNYYLFVNSPLEPVDSIITFLSTQYLYYMVIVVIAAFIISYILSDGITKPIVNMREEADKLSKADYSAHFDGGTYTETRELATTLNDAKDKLSKIDELRKDLIANISHDIKTPLTSIRAYAEMVRDVSGNNPAKRNEHLNTIINEADYLDRLVTDMNELSRMQSGNYKLNLNYFNLVTVINDLTLHYEPLFKENNLNVHLDLPDEMIVYADETKIAQVISNFISNAIKHTPAGKNIYMKLTCQDEEIVRFELQDEGEGISEKDLPYIWDRYQKSSRSFSRNISSTGLGLSIVKAILDAHHATYGVSSKLNTGSTFWFELKLPAMEEPDDGNGLFAGDKL